MVAIVENKKSSGLGEKIYYLYIISRSDLGNWEEYESFLVSARSHIEALSVINNNTYLFDGVEWDKPAGIWDQTRRIGISNIPESRVLMRSKI